ncbi:hypothetical protein MD484_g8609, partial [Candolleomyces efflorescens]
MIPPSLARSSTDVDIVDPGSDSGEGFVEVVNQGRRTNLVFDEEDSMEEVTMHDGGNKADVSDGNESAELVVVDSLTENDDPGNQTPVPVIKRPKRKATSVRPSEYHSSDVEEPPKHPCGRSVAATRIKGRGFLLPPPTRSSAATQTSEPCAFQSFLRNPSQYQENDPRRFWMEMGRRVFAGSSADPPPTPTDSVESYEVMRCLDYDIGIPADQFLTLFDVCPRCSHVMTRYWFEDHDSVCPANIQS